MNQPLHVQPANHEAVANFPVMCQYRHHKGDTYVLLAIANQDSDREGFVPTAVYHSLTNGKIYTRPFSEFAEKFTLVSTDYEAVRFDLEQGEKVVLSGIFDGTRHQLKKIEIAKSLLVAFSHTIAIEI